MQSCVVAPTSLGETMTLEHAPENNRTTMDKLVKLGVQINCVLIVIIAVALFMMFIVMIIGCLIGNVAWDSWFVWMSLAAFLGASALSSHMYDVVHRKRVWAYGSNDQRMLPDSPNTSEPIGAARPSQVTIISS